jgi:hypothetical protein
VRALPESLPHLHISNHLHVVRCVDSTDVPVCWGLLDCLSLRLLRRCHGPHVQAVCLHLRVVCRP